MGGEAFVVRFAQRLDVQWNKNIIKEREYNFLVRKNKSRSYFELGISWSRIFHGPPVTDQINN